MLKYLLLIFLYLLITSCNHNIDLVYNENRVLYPHKRGGPKGPGAKFERISWDEALEYADKGKLEIKKKRNGKSNLAGFGSE